MSVRAVSLLSALVATVWLGLSPASAQTTTRVIETLPTVSSLTQVARLNDTFKTQQAETTPATAPAKRIALVIGNSAYKTVTPLNNPVNDGKAISQFLTTAGFDVVSAVDLTRDQITEVFTTFTSMISERGSNTVVLVYYAGHGLQVDGENFLVPVDAKIEKEDDIAEEGVRLLDVMKTLEAVPSAMRIVIMDACRNNPFSALGDVAGKGLAIVDAPTGSIVAYSTAPGAEALDGTGKFSPYAAALMKASKQPGLSIELVFKRVRLLVNEATDGKQIPWESSSLTGDFAFFSPAGTVGQVIAAAPAPKVQRIAEISTRPVNDAYSIAIEEDSVEYYEEFIRVYPTHPLCERIRTLLSRRQQAVAWHQTVKRNTAADYAAFAARFANSDFARQARRLQVKPRQQFQFRILAKGNFSNGQIFNRNNQGKGGIFNNGNNGGFPKGGIPGNLGNNKIGIPGNVGGNNNGGVNGANNGGRPGQVANVPNGGVSKFGQPGIIGRLPTVNKGNIPGVGNNGAGRPGGQVTTLPTNGGIVPNNNRRPRLPANVGSSNVGSSSINGRVFNGGNNNPAALNNRINRAQQIQRIQQSPAISQAVQSRTTQRFQSAPTQRFQSAPVQRNFNAGSLSGGNQGNFRRR